MCINYNWLQKIYYIISIYKSYLICWRQTGKSILIFKESIKISCYILAIWIVCSDYHPDHHENCHLNVKNCQKLDIFLNKFLAIFWHSNGNFPEGQLSSMKWRRIHFGTVSLLCMTSMYKIRRRYKLARQW